MGNRALRCQLAEKLKEKNIPSRPYKGKRPSKLLKASSLKRLIAILDCLPDPDKPETGAAVRTCGYHNFWNRRVVKLYYSKYDRLMDGKSSAVMLYVSDILLDDQSQLCSCIGIPSEYVNNVPTQEQVEEAFVETIEEQPDKYEVDSLPWRAYTWIKAGAHITDSDGILLPEWQDLNAISLKSVLNRLYSWKH